MAATIEANQAAWLDGVGKSLRVGPADDRRPGKNQIVIRNRAVAVNPIDWKRQDCGYGIQHWPYISGLDAGGEVFEVGSGVTRVKKGDRIIAHLDPTKSADGSTGAFQLYAVANANQTAKIPDSLSFQQACVLPLAFGTALVGLCGEEGKLGLGLPLPSLHSSPVNRTVVIWGGSSAVGSMAIQLAVAAGMEVVAVASARNAELCRRCGANKLLDYRSRSVVEDVVKATRECGGDFAGVFNAISTPDSYASVFPIMEKLGGGRMLHTTPLSKDDVPEYVEPVMVHGTKPEVTDPYWESYIPAALETGKLKCLPEALVIGKGMEHAQMALDTLREGVSAQKIVLEL